MFTALTSASRVAAAFAIAVALIAGSASALTVPNYQGLWWASPAGSESGWGINFAHQDDTIFATWFTYDRAGKAIWWSMTAAKSGERRYSGDLVQTTGPPSSAQPFDPSAVTRTVIGAGTLTFVDERAGTFAYTVNGLAQLKPLVRQVFGPVPACTYLAPADLARATNYQDLWWVAEGAESGWGLDIAHQGDTIFASWFTYGADGSPSWLSMTAVRQGAGEIFGGELVLTAGARFDSFDSTTVTRTAVGSATLTFADGNRATFEYTLQLPGMESAVSRSKVITRQTFLSGAGTVCHPLHDPQFVVTNLSPFSAGCDGTPTGAAYVNSEVEPMLAVDPHDPSHLIGAWQQDRWASGGARGIVSGVSFDGGRNWARSMAALSRCTGGNASNGGNYERATDPWVSIGPDNVAYQIALAFDRSGRNAILVSRSVDGGLAWSAPAKLIEDGGDPFNDKEMVVADPAVPGYAYATWDRLSESGHGPTYFSRTTDAGSSWEPARPIYDPGGINQTINNQVVVLGDGTLITFFTRFDVVGNDDVRATLALVRSTDRGMTWSPAIAIADVRSVGTRDPHTDAFVRDGSTLGSIAAGPGNSLVVVWADSRFSGGARDGIALTRSDDGGLTWSTPIPIHGNVDVPAFGPTVAARIDGTIAVTYFDFRSDTDEASTLLTDYWLTRSTDGAGWRESRVAGPFDLAIAPNSEGWFVGDYQGLVGVGDAFVAFYAIGNNGAIENRTNVIASIVTSSGTLPTASLGTSVDTLAKRSTLARSPDVSPDVERRIAENVKRALARQTPRVLSRARNANAATD